MKVNVIVVDKKTGIEILNIRSSRGKLVFKDLFDFNSAVGLSVDEILRIKEEINEIKTSVRGC